MAITPTKKQIAGMVGVLDEDHASMEDAALAVFAYAMEVFEQRANFTVVGQVRETKDKGRLKDGDPEAVKVALGWYDTRGKAEGAASSWAYSAASGDHLNVLVLPVFHGTPAEWHKESREKTTDSEIKAAEKREAAFRESMAKHQRDIDERVEKMHAMEAETGQKWPCDRVSERFNRCRHNPRCPTLEGK